MVTTATDEKGWMCFQSEMWALVTLVCLDDLPFFILRIVCMAGFGVMGYNIYFFTFKNGLVLILDCNRLYALYKGMKKEEEISNSANAGSREVGSVRLIHLRR